MLFRRRVKPTVGERVRIWLWPRRSFRRSFNYLKKRVLRLDATPHAIAAGIAAGVFSSFTPFVGFHFLISFAIAYLIAGNMVAAALGCGVGNPVTFGPIWASTYELGRWLTAAEPIDGSAPAGLGHALANMRLTDMWEPILKPMLIGSVPLGLAAALVAYGAVYLAARSFQAHRTRRMEALRERHRRETLAAAQGAR
jgi:uncharacterized protein